MIREEVGMHIVEVIGGNKTQRKIAENVVFYMIKKLMPRLRNIEIEVQLKWVMFMINQKIYLLKIL